MNNIKIIRKNIKNIILKVKSDGSISLTAPRGISSEYIKDLLIKKSDWIKEKQLLFKNSKEISLNKYYDGELFSYLGNRYKLKTIKSDIEKVTINSEYLEIYIKDEDHSRKEILIKKWYRKRAELIFFNILQELNRIVKKDVNRIKIRDMKTRWGSCNHNKSYINLNLELIKKPKECIEYVVLHELTHLIHPNHSKEFYNYLTLHMPDWKIRKELLKK